MGTVRASVAVLFALVTATPLASAQEAVLPKWDAGASFGLFWGDGWQPSLNGYSDTTNVAYQFDLGRFWTTHVKSDFGVVLTPRRNGYETVALPFAGVNGPYAFDSVERSVTAFTGAASYQFFENDFMHPFVSAGVQMGLANEHRSRPQQTYTINRVSYVAPAVDSESREVLARPFVAVGAKSYFNERTFVRSELLVAFKSGGYSHATLRLGFGVDF
jgi:hypothetical protein